MTSLSTHTGFGLLVMLAKQELERHAFPEGKQDHKTAFLPPPETQCYARGKKKIPKEYRKIDNIHSESEWFGFKL